MSKVLEFRKPDPPKEQHGSGPAFCMGCKHEWVAVAPTGTTELECPACNTMKGRFRFEFQPPPETLIRVCNCGNQYFYITPEGHLCANCGTWQEY